jgi:transcriptional regulator of nitric oxide reductase
MTSLSFAAGYVLPTSKLEVRPAARQATSWSWRAVADHASGLIFLGALGFEVWRMGSVLWQLVPQVAAGGGYLF